MSFCAKEKGMTELFFAFKKAKLYETKENYYRVVFPFSFINKKLCTSENQGIFSDFLRGEYGKNCFISLNVEEKDKLKKNHFNSSENSVIKEIIKVLEAEVISADIDIFDD